MESSQYIVPHPLSMLALASDMKTEEPQYQKPASTKNKIPASEKQEIRTKRYVNVIVEGLDLTQLKKKVILSWYHDGNGIPRSCYIITIERLEELVISMKNSQGRGWVDIDTSKAQYPDFKVEFQIRLDFADEASDKKPEDAVLQFYLKEKEGDLVKTIGQCSIPITLKCTKHKSDVIIGQLREVVEAEMLVAPAMGSMTFTGATVAPKFTNQVPQPTSTFLPLSSSFQLPPQTFQRFH